MTRAFSNCFSSLRWRPHAFSAIIPLLLLLLPLLLSRGQVQMLALLETPGRVPPVGSSPRVPLCGLGTLPGSGLFPWGLPSNPAASPPPPLRSAHARPPVRKAAPPGAGTASQFLGTDVNRDPARRLEMQRESCRAALSPRSRFLLLRICCLKHLRPQ